MAKKRDPWNPLLCNYPDSEKINNISIAAETLFIRLIAKCDDNANFSGSPIQLLCKLYSMRLEKGQVTIEDVAKWRQGLVKEDLVTLYKVRAVEYLHINNCKKATRKDVARDERFPTQAVVKKGDNESGPDLFRDCDETEPLEQTITEQNIYISPTLFTEYWNKKPPLPKIIIFNKDRKDHLSARCKVKLFCDNWQKIINNLSQSGFHTGQNERGWKATIDWILKNDTNYIKILELPEQGQVVRGQDGLTARQREEERIKKQKEKQRADQ